MCTLITNIFVLRPNTCKVIDGNAGVDIILHSWTFTPVGTKPSKPPLMSNSGSRLFIERQVTLYWWMLKRTSGAMKLFVPASEVVFCRKQGHALVRVYTGSALSWKTSAHRMHPRPPYSTRQQTTWGSAVPKSMILAQKPSAVSFNTMLSGFKSRCTICGVKKRGLYFLRTLQPHPHWTKSE